MAPRQGTDRGHRRSPGDRGIIPGVQIGRVIPDGGRLLYDPDRAPPVV